MTKLTSRRPKLRTVADLIKRLGDIPPARIRMDPLPGTATERDVLDVEARENRLCELVRGVLVEKTTGHFESRLAAVLIYFLETFLDRSDLGIVYGADATLRLMPHLVRIPDVSFVSWQKLPDRELPAEPIPDLVPDLAVEVLSEGNTAREMQLKLREYFSVGVRLVWLIDPATHPRLPTELGRERRPSGRKVRSKGAPSCPDFASPFRPYSPEPAASEDAGAERTNEFIQEEDAKSACTSREPLHDEIYPDALSIGRRPATGTSTRLCAEGGRAAPRLHLAGHSDGQASFARGFPRQEGPADPIRLVVSGMSQARAGLARGAGEMGEGRKAGAPGHHPGTTSGPLSLAGAVAGLRLANPPRSDQHHGRRPPFPSSWRSTSTASSVTPGPRLDTIRDGIHHQVLCL